MFGWQLTPPKATDDFLRFVEETRWERTPRILRALITECLELKYSFWDTEHPFWRVASVLLGLLLFWGVIPGILLRGIVRAKENNYVGLQDRQ